jgi:hypothetical protein
MADVPGKFFSARKVRTGVSPSSPGVEVGATTTPVNPALTGVVPYTGATQNVDLGEFGLDTGFVTLDTTPTNIPTEQGGIYWDDARSTAALIMNGTLQHIGQDTFFYVKNSTGSSIAKGTAVRFDGTDGASGHIKIAAFLANGTYPSSYFMGVTAEAIANGEFGQVMHFGELDGINTSSYTAGALLYASTSVAGGFQTTVPVAPNNIVLIAAAINSKNNGSIIVRPTYGSNINQDEGVKITTPTTGDLLQLQAGGLWENKTKAQILGGTSAQFVKGDGSLDSNTYGTGTVTSVGLSSATSGVTIGSTPVTTSGTITLAIATASGSQNGLLSSTDWTTFNSKQNALTNPVTGTGTSGQVAYFTGTSAISSESNLFWDATNDRLGIGTAIPTARLHLNGFTGAVNQAKGIKLTNNAGTIVALEVGDSNDSYVGTISGSKFSIRCNNNPAITVDTALNVGIGFTPSTWDTSIFKALQIGTSNPAFLIGRTDAFSQMQIGVNAYYDGTSWKHVATNAATRYYQNGGEHVWENAVSGSANSTVAWVESMKITSDTAAFLRLASGTGGIQFNGDTAAANALDDYEEGTWTPTITGGYTGITYAFQNGWYRKIGSAVIVSGRVRFSGTANAAGITMACPFTQGPTGYGSGGIPFSDIAVITNTHPYITGGSSSVLFYTTGTGAQIGSSANVADKWLSFVITMSV